MGLRMGVCCDPRSQCKETRYIGHFRYVRSRLVLGALDKYISGKLSSVIVRLGGEKTRNIAAYSVADKLQML